MIHTMTLSVSVARACARQAKVDGGGAAARQASEAEIAQSQEAIAVQASPPWEVMWVVGGGPIRADLAVVQQSKRPLRSCRTNCASVITSDLAVQARGAPSAAMVSRIVKSVGCSMASGGDSIVAPIRPTGKCKTVVSPRNWGGSSAV